MASHTLRHMAALVFSTPMLFAGIAFAQCGAPNANDCCAPSTSPGCAEATCCEFVCSFDISCCDVAWDASCAQKAIQFCQTCSGQGGGGCGKTSPNDCCTASVTPGCSDATCCEAVCAVDPFCCIDAWSQSCAAQALQLCTTCDDICGAPNANDCCTPSQTPGCSDATCCETVCTLDPGCCIFGWDLGCVNIANDLCKSCGGGGGSVCGNPNAGDCCTLSQFAGCSDAVCCETVCAVDPSCCDLFWDMDCVNKANHLCDSCGGATTCGAPNANDCCAPSTSPGCAEATCCELVCSFDFSCCDVAWDASCAQKAIQFCQTCSGQGGGGCGKTSPNDCCTASVTPGCSDATCCEAVCAVDPFCCIDAWSQSCAAQALQLCTTCDDICGAPNANDCCTPSQTPGCSDATCCETVCTLDPGCCIFGWDLGCVNIANDLCKSCGGGGGSVCGNPNAGDCCTLSQFAGCSDAVCCETVCAVDPSCCDLFWDMDCVNSAKTMCESCGAPPCTGDVTGDGTVDGSDLAAVLVAWGSNGQGQVDTDLNDDGIVDGSDLTFILVGWGACE